MVDTRPRAALWESICDVNVDSRVRRRQKAAGSRYTDGNGRVLLTAQNTDFWLNRSTYQKMYRRTPPYFDLLFPKIILFLRFFHYLEGKSLLVYPKHFISYNKWLLKIFCGTKAIINYIGEAQGTPQNISRENSWAILRLFRSMNFF